MSCQLYDLQDQIRTYLLAKDYFAEMQVISERPKSIDDRVAKLSAKYSGLFITILTVEGRKNDADYLAPVCSDIFVDIHVTEKVNINRVGEDFRPAPEVIEHLMRTLHYTFQPAAAEDRLSYQYFQPEAAQGDTLILGVRFKTTIKFAAEPENVAP